MYRGSFCTVDAVAADVDGVVLLRPSETVENVGAVAGKRYWPSSDRVPGMEEGNSFDQICFATLTDAEG